MTGVLEYKVPRQSLWYLVHDLASKGSKSRVDLDRAGLTAYITEGGTVG